MTPLPGYRWYNFLPITIAVFKNSDSVPIVEVHQETGLVCCID